MGVRITEWIVEVNAREHSLQLRLMSDEGLVGHSEAPLPQRPGLLLAMLDDIRSKEEATLDPCSAAVFASRVLKAEGNGPCPTLSTAIALVEMACWDLKAKALGVPLHELWGGAVRERIPVCAAGWEPSERSADAFVEAAREVAAIGYKILSLDPFGNLGSELGRADLSRTIRLCESVRAAVGPEVAIWIHFGGRFRPSDVVRLAHSLERMEAAGIFDPLDSDNRHALADLSRRVMTPLALSQNLTHWSAPRDAIVGGGVSLIAPDVATACGFSAVRTLAALAETNGVDMALRVRTGETGLAGAIHLGATLPNLRFIEHNADHRGKLPSRFGFVDGAFLLPNGPGLGTV
jgi:galactonate dehydratase